MKKNNKKYFAKISKGAFVTMCVLLFATVGCKKDKYDIYENHNISACGVNDPLQNIAWLKEYCRDIIVKKISPVYIYLLKVYDSDEYFFEISIYNQPRKGRISLKYLNCNGDTVYEKETWMGPDPSVLVPPPPDPWFKDKGYITELFHFVKQ